MPLTLDPVSLKKLSLVKQIYQQAQIQSQSRQSPVSRIIALVTFDLATETMLKAVYSALEPTKDPDKQFQGLVQSVDALLKAQGLPAVPDQRQIQHVHTLRNDAQHKAKYPTEVEATDCRALTYAFLENITQQIWGRHSKRLALLIWFSTWKSNKGS